MYHSTSGTFIPSCDIVTFSIMPSVSQAYLMHSNHPSLSLFLISNLLQSNALIICCRDIMIVTVFSFWILLAVPKCISLDVAMRKGILLIYIRLTPRVMLTCHSNIPSTKFLHVVRKTIEGVLHQEYLLLRLYMNSELWSKSLHP